MYDRFLLSDIPLFDNTHLPDRQVVAASVWPELVPLRYKYTQVVEIDTCTCKKKCLSSTKCVNILLHVRCNF